MISEGDDMKRIVTIAILTVLGTANSAFAEREGNVAENGSASEQNVQSQEKPGRRPACDYGLTDLRRYDLNPNFYIEKKKLVPTGSVIKKDDVLFYGQYAEAKMFAVADDLIENIDKSPLTRNWKIEPNERKEVFYTFSGDGRTNHYLIYSGGHAFWVSNMEGMLCNNVFDIDRGRVSFTGMPQVFQTKPMRFETVEQRGAPVRAVSVTAKEISGATVTLEMNVMLAGRSIKKKEQVFDAMGGAFEFSGLTFELVRDQSGWKLASVAEPQNIGFWLHLTLGSPRGR